MDARVRRRDVVTSVLATGSYPDGPFSYPDLTQNLFYAAQAGFIEEIVVLALVVTTLERARRPRAELVAVALLLRASYHFYYDPASSACSSGQPCSCGCSYVFGR